MRLIEKAKVPAPAPIEQRWTSSSSASMSPVHDRASSETVRQLSETLSSSQASLCSAPFLNVIQSKAETTCVYITFCPLLPCAARGKLFSWVGVIMYLPADDMDARGRVTTAFLAYRDLCKAQLWDRCVYVLCPFLLRYVCVDEFETKIW